MYLNSKLHMPSSNGILSIVIKPTDNSRFRAATMLFFILQKGNLRERNKKRKDAYFSKICYLTKFQNVTLSDASVVLTSEIQTVAMLVLLLT